LLTDHEEQADVGKPGRIHSSEQDFADGVDRFDGINPWMKYGAVDGSLYPFTLLVWLAVV
jgi:hypothetical protein